MLKRTACCAFTSPSMRTSVVSHFFGPSGCAHLQVGFKTGGAHFVEGFFGVQFQCFWGVVEAAAGDAMFYQREFFGSSEGDFIGVAGVFTAGVGFGNFILFYRVLPNFEGEGIGDYPAQFFGFDCDKQIMVVHFLFYFIPKFFIVVGIFIDHITIEVVFYFDDAITVCGDIVL